MPAFQPYRGKPVVRNDREGRGNDGIIRSPGSRLDPTRLRGALSSKLRMIRAATTSRPPTASQSRRHPPPRRQGHLPPVVHLERSELGHCYLPFRLSWITRASARRRVAPHMSGMRMMTMHSQTATRRRIMTAATPTWQSNVSSANCGERAGCARDVRWRAPARKEFRNGSNRSEREPTSAHSTKYGSVHLIPAFRGTGRTFS
jgi:hypothetical protein